MKTICAILLIAAASLFAATQHVTSTVTSTALQAAVDQLVAGDTLYFGGGTYARDTVLMLRGLHGTVSQPIVLCPEPGATPHLRHNNQYTTFVNILSGGAYLNVITVVGGCWHVIIQGLELSRGRTGIETWDPAAEASRAPDSNITVKDCNIHDVGNNGIRIATNPNHHWKFIHNHIHHTLTYGEGFYIGDNTQPSFGNPHHLEFINNWVHNTSTLGTIISGDGIDLKAGAHSCIIRSNVFHNTIYPGLLLYGTTAVGGARRDKSFNNVAYNNFIFSTTEAGIQAAGTATVFNNILFDCGAGGSGMQINYNATWGALRQVHCFNNTIINSTFWFDNFSTQAESCIIKNNALYHSASGQAVSFAQTATSGVASMFSNNKYYGTLGSATAVAAGFSVSTQGFNAFANKAGYNVYPASASSEVVNAGVDLSAYHALANRDFNGNLRTGTWDVGALEFDAARPANIGWILSSTAGGFIDTTLQAGTAINAFFEGFDNDAPLAVSASPNPLNPSTVLSFSGLTAGRLYNPTYAKFLGIFDVQGRCVTNLTHALKSGNSRIVWNAQGLASGTYVVRLIVGKHTATHTLTLVR